MRTITNTDLAVTNSAKCDATKTLFTAEQLGQFATEFVVTIDAKESGESGTGGEMGGEAGNEGRARGKPLPASRNNEEIESARLETRSRQNGKQQILSLIHI